MTYEKAKELKCHLESINKLHSENLNSFDDKHGGSNEIGLIPDHVRELPERKELNRKFEASFRELQNFNQWFIKTFKKEYRAERNKRFATK